MTHRPYVNFWDRLDSYGHRSPYRYVIPRFIRNWICYKFDESLGVYDDFEDFEDV